MKNFNQRGRGNRPNFGGQTLNNRSMHPAVCASCGQACEVPFVPSGDKPVYCNNCFAKNKNSDSQGAGRRDFGRSDFRDKQMFSAVCAKCGKTCEVPFKPSGDKPVFCSDCFSQNRGGSGKNSGFTTQSHERSGLTKEQFDQINSKLDKVLKALNISVKEIPVIKPEKATAAIVEKKVEPKKASKKKAIVLSGKSKKKKK